MSKLIHWQDLNLLSSARHQAEPITTVIPYGGGDLFSASQRITANHLNRQSSLLSGENKMTTQGLLGFRYNDVDKLTYNHSDSGPDTLGFKVLKELHAVDNWDAARQRIDSLHSIPEARRLDEHSSMAESEIRRHFPNLEYKGEPKNFYDLYQPLQGTLKPYLDGELMFMPDASDFINNSLHCEWAYIANLDTDQFEVWKGLQTKPDTDENRYGAEADRMGHYPCTMLMGYHLDDMPDPVRFMADYTFYRDLTGSSEKRS